MAHPQFQEVKAGNLLAQPVGELSYVDKVPYVTFIQCTLLG